MIRQMRCLWGISVPAVRFAEIQGLACYLLADVDERLKTPVSRRRAAELAARTVAEWRDTQRELCRPLVEMA